MPPAAGEAQRGIRNDHVSLLTALEGDSCGTKPVATPRIHGRYGTALIRRPIAFGNRLFRPAFVALRDHLNRIDLRGVGNRPSRVPSALITCTPGSVLTYRRPSASTVLPSPAVFGCSCAKSRWLVSDPSGCTSNTTTVPTFVTYSFFSSGLRMIPFVRKLSPYFATTPVGLA